MAKRKARKTKEAPKQHELPGGFWHQVAAVVMLAVAVILIMTWFGSGGSLLNHIHDGGLWLIGYATYFIPVLLVYLAVKIFRSGDNRLPIVMWIASFLMMFWLAGLSGIPTIGKENPTGGVIGAGLNSLAVQILEPGVAAFIYVVLIFVTVIFILQTSPATVFKAIASIFKVRERGEDVANAKVARELQKEPKGKLDLKINSGVAVVDAAEKMSKSLPVKKAAPVAVESEKALIAVNDANWKMPSVELLEKKQSSADPGNAQQNAMIIESTDLYAPEEQDGTYVYEAMDGKTYYFRFNIGLTAKKPHITIRKLINSVPTVEAIKMNEGEGAKFFEECMKMKEGLYLVIGATGSGKSTTLTCVLDAMLKSGGKKVITLEEPIEYYYKTLDYEKYNSIIIQRQVGFDTKSFNTTRSEERRVGKECRSRWSPYH